MPRADFKPALKFSALNQLYDFLTVWFFKRTAFYNVFVEVLESLHLQPNMKLLELGCGPGRLSIRIKKEFPTAHITAVDRDPRILRLAKKNAQRADVDITFKEKDISELGLKGPYDRIYSTLVFHHIPIASKEKTLKSISKLLSKKGLFVLADFCGTKTLAERLKFIPVQLVDGFETTAAHPQGWLEENLLQYFSHVERKLKVSTLLGPVGVFVCHH